MEFWGVEAKIGEPIKVAPGDGMVLHLSQASLGELKKDKGNETVCLFVNIDGKKLVLGTLFADRLPQQQFDLVFDKDFELSHNWKNGSVYFYGYKASNPFDEDTELPHSEESDSEEDIPITLANNGKPVLKAKKDKPAEAEKTSAKDKESIAGKQKVQAVEPSRDTKPRNYESSDDDIMSVDDDEVGSEDDEESDDSDEESDESNEETPNTVGPSKKRAAESASKTPVPDKKAKDGKKAGDHVATPYPAKQAWKTPADKPNQQTPKTGPHSCKACNRTFGSDKALESHTKAKHATGK